MSPHDSYEDVVLWESIKDRVEGSTASLVEALEDEIQNDALLQQYRQEKPISHQFRRVLEQRADRWVQREYDICCGAWGRPASQDFNRAVWTFAVDPFIDKYLYDLLLRAIGIRLPRSRDPLSRFLASLIRRPGAPKEAKPIPALSGAEVDERHLVRADQKGCCQDVKGRISKLWHAKLVLGRSEDPEIAEAAATMVRAEARQARPVPPATHSGSPAKRPVFDQAVNFRNAIRQKKAKIAEIESALARPMIRTDSRGTWRTTAGSRLRLQEERLLLEEGIRGLETALLLHNFNQSRDPHVRAAIAQELRQRGTPLRLDLEEAIAQELAQPEPPLRKPDVVTQPAAEPPPPVSVSRRRAIRFRSKLSIAIGQAIIAKPNATAQEICEWIDDEAQTELPTEKWPGCNGCLVSAYRVPALRKRLDVAISKVRKKLNG